ncbi:MAG: hypothetical protein WCG04_05805 [Alphaproteobacteria bacterium]
MNTQPQDALLVPHLRHNLIGALEDLANKERRVMESPKNSYPYTFSDSILMVIGVFDDLDMYDSTPDDHIGYTIYNHGEAQAINQVIEAVKCVCSKIGVKQPDSAYINSSLWEELIHTAEHAYDVLLANEPNDSLALECDTYGWEISDLYLRKSAKDDHWVWWDEDYPAKQAKGAGRG